MQISKEKTWESKDAGEFSAARRDGRPAMIDATRSNIATHNSSHAPHPFTQGIGLTYTFASATVLLLLICDPLGNIPIFANALRHVAPERRAGVILREVLIAFVLLLGFMFVGDTFLRVMGLSGLSLQIAGAVVLFLIALRMIFPNHTAYESTDTREPLIVPLAIPALAGPSALATVMLLVSQAPERRLEWIAALSVTMAVCALVLVLSDRIQRLIGDRVVLALERLMGLILVAVAVEMMIRGLKSLALEMGR